jgi:hypothetical protein
MTEFKHIVTPEEAGKSVKELMRQHFTFSSRLMTKLKFQKLIYLNGEQMPSWVPTAPGDEIVIKMPDEASDFPPEDIPINVVYEEPTTWENNTYWKLPDYDNLYFQLVERGDTTQEFEAKDIVNLRYKRYTLEEHADTISNWSIQDNPNAIEVQYMVQTDQSCTGWQMAIKYMKYNKAQCRIICPSKLGFSQENSSVTPYGYDLKITNP